ncbi:MAG: lamin tail domain-containing protein, partial [Patescibacteria group bacterium]
GWKFWEDNTNHALTLAQGSDAIIGSGEFALIVQNDAIFKTDHPEVTATIFDSSWGTLNESGEEIGLKKDAETIIEQFIYIEAKDFSLERNDARVRDYSSANWHEHVSGHTAGAVNSTVGAVNPPPQNPENSTSTASLVINEFLPDPGANGEEWVELFNPTDTAVPLTGWSMHDATGGSIASPTGTIPARAFFVVVLTSSRLNNGGDTIALYNPNDALVDRVIYGTATSTAPVPEPLHSVARKTDGADTGNDSNDFAETTTPTKGASNVITAPAANPANPSPPSSPQSSGGGGGNPIPQFRLRDILLNELFIDPGEDGDEFVELFNPGERNIPLDGWWIEDGAETRTKMAGSIGSKKFFVIERPKGDLNDAGDTLFLFDPYGTIIDRVTYGKWQDGNLSDNAPLPSRFQSIARETDGADTDRDAADFAETRVVTKGFGNIIVAGEQGKGFAAETGMRITEIFPNPIGSDLSDEFIEITNMGSSTMDMRGWTIRDGSGFSYVISRTTWLPPGISFLVWRRESNIALDNTNSEDVSLYTPDGLLADVVGYTGVAFEGQSYAQKKDGTWQWTMNPTPGEENMLVQKNTPPHIVIEADTHVAANEDVTFDASDTTDADGGRLMFAWEFGDSVRVFGDVVQHQFREKGTYRVTLSVSDVSFATSSETVVVTVGDTHVFVGSFSLQENASGVGIEISEISPNPVGRDEEGEFIELYNPTDIPVQLAGFFLDDADGGSRPYQFASGTVLLPREYKVLPYAETHLTLNNASDEVRLLNGERQAVLSVAYDGGSEGETYAKDDEGEWMWTAMPTPGKENIINMRNTKNTKVRNDAAPSIGQVKGIKILAGGVSLEDVKNYDVGTAVTVTGVVAVLPGVFGSQYFYIVGSPGIQIYMNKRDFPSLEIGDRVSVSGKISDAYGEKRINVAGKDFIQKIAAGDPPAPASVETADIDDALAGSLVRLSGEITELKSSYLFLDDGTDEVKIYFKNGANVNRRKFAVGDFVAVTGIVSKSRSGEFQILPRSQADISAQERNSVGEERDGDNQQMPAATKR